MRGLKIIAPTTVGIALALSATSALAAGDPRGVWLDDTGRGAVEIKNCGDALCGTVVWAKSEKDSKDGCGKQILGDVKSVGGGSWDNGWIYDPERGRKFDLALTPTNDGKLQVMGYAGYKFLSQTMIWTKAPDDLQRCDKPDVQADKTDARKDDDAKAANNDEPAKEKAEAKPIDDEPQQKVATAEADTTKSPAEAKSDEGDKDLSVDKPKQESADEKGKDEKNTASDDKNAGSGNMKIGGLELDKVFTKTKSGKCQVDLPFVKMTFNCEQ